MTNERIHFRLIHMECCGQLLCWVNPRFPTHCPECGRTVYPQVKGWVTMEDTNAHIRYSMPSPGERPLIKELKGLGIKRQAN
ncbi:hypothetical protein LCGC14_1599000 [marine sediment metagenome]|uniref:Uncharacterized protein n=1 Tax=marine sediment metagenome TaxID=412755 RepID=A0A0F9IBQ9_9ZZZZ